MEGRHQKKKPRKINWASVHPISMCLEKEEQKQRLWAEKISMLVDKMGSALLHREEKAASKVLDLVESSTVVADEIVELADVLNQIEVAAPVQDSEGYLICKRGSRITERFKVVKKMGGGVFSNVVLVEDIGEVQKQASSEMQPSRKAIKIVRNIDAYRNAARSEIAILQQLHHFDQNDEEACKSCSHLVVKLQNHFNYFGHACLLFDSYGQSIFDFMKSNNFHPYPFDQIRYIAFQLILAVKFVHDRGLIHTDLKPENILFVDSDNYEMRSRWESSPAEFKTKQRRGRNKKIRVLRDASIRLIDFGSAVFGYHKGIITTRHYRAPEVVLKIPWSYPSDVWSLGCILFELYVGDTLFARMKDVFHLATIERTLGAVPERVKQAHIAESKKQFSKSFYLEDGSLDCTQSLWDSVRHQSKPLSHYMKSSQLEHRQFFNLLELMLTIDPNLRIDLKTAKEHEFFASLDKGLRFKAENGANNVNS